MTRIENEKNMSLKRQLAHLKTTMHWSTNVGLALLSAYFYGTTANDLPQDATSAQVTLVLAGAAYAVTVISGIILQIRKENLHGFIWYECGEGWKDENGMKL